MQFSRSTWAQNKRCEKRYNRYVILRIVLKLTPQLNLILNISCMLMPFRIRKYFPFRGAVLISIWSQNKQWEKAANPNIISRIALKLAPRPYLILDISCILIPFRIRQYFSWAALGLARALALALAVALALALALPE